MARRLAFKPRAALDVLGSVWTHPANRSHRLRALRRCLLIQLRGRIFGLPTILPYGRSSQIIVRLDDAGSKRGGYAALPDWSEMSAWIRHLDPGDLFIDVGANVGLYSLLAGEIGCEVVAVEPLPRARRQLVENLALNRQRAKVIDAALADRAGTMNLRGPDALRQHLSYDSHEGLEVRVLTLDSLLGSRFAAGVKIDVEGAERMVVDGGRNAFAGKRIGLCQLEWNTMSEKNFGESRSLLADTLREYGYSLCRPDAHGDLRPVADLSPGADLFACPQAL